jgi:hypothetical protein
MKHVPVDSSMISHVGYNAETQTLAVKFRKGGWTYHYSGVSAEKHADMMKADSIGKFLQTHVINAGHKHTRQEK